MTETIQIAASQNGQQIGAAGDFLESLIIVPHSLSPGEVTLHDAEAAIVLFVGGSGSVSDLRPISVALGLRAKSGAWAISTGGDISVIATVGEASPEAYGREAENLGH